MARRFLPLTLALLLALPAAHAEPPKVGYDFTSDPRDQGAMVPQGGVATYNLTLTLAPATGDTRVDLLVSYSDFRAVHPDSIAPSATVSLRKVSESTYSNALFVSGFKGSAGYRSASVRLDPGQYLVRVSSTLDDATPLGNHTSHLGFTARDPDTFTSNGTASYPFHYDVREAPNHPPTAAFTVSVSGLTVTVNAASSTDPDGDPLTFLWDFFDGGVGAGSPASHTYAAGNWVIRLTAIDPRGASDTAEHSVTIGGGSTTTTGPPPNGGSGGSGGGTSGTVATDSDNDGVSDADELAAGSDPNQSASVPSDRDADGKPNEADNCPNASNADQADGDGDHIGNVCDLKLDDGPTADPDGDGKPSNADSCPAAPNANQTDLDGDGKGDACDTDTDGDGILDVADAFPREPKESKDSDGDGLGDNADLDDDNDLVPDAQEAAGGSDPFDRHDPPWLAGAATALRRADGSNLVSWHAPADARLQRFLLWREASPYVLLATIPAADAGSYGYVDDAPPAHARYHVQAQLDGMDALKYVGDDDRATNWVTANGAIAEGCDASSEDADHDGLCDALERSMGLSPSDADTDHDGLKDGDELLGLQGPASIPTEADSDGDGISDSAERKAGTDPLGIRAVTVEPKEGKGLPGWLWPAVIIAAAVVLAALILLVRKPPRAGRPPPPQP
jgi:hypothetical protein